MVTDMLLEFLRARWHRTLSSTLKAPKNGMADGVCDQILASYSESSRHYHTAEHLMNCFQVFDRVFPVQTPDALPASGVTSLTPEGRGCVELALWFHDIVYDPKDTTSNEAQSAEVAGDVLRGLDLPRFVEPVKALILLTKHDATPETNEARVLVDVDLAILGEPPAMFDAYERNVRKEFSWVDPDAFKVGRAKVLKRFLDREWIYFTPEMRRNGFEGRAQDNLRRSLKALEGTSSVDSWSAP